MGEADGYDLFRAATMKIYQSSTDYAGYSFPTVSLAYFLRYPNPKATHVKSTDVLSQYIDPITKRLHTVRLHLKKSKVPAAALKFLPKAMSAPDGTSQTYILEKTVIDVNEGWMETESRNMEWTGVLSVIEKQSYRDKARFNLDGVPGTHCDTTVTFVSRLGEKIKKRRRASQSAADTTPHEVDEEQPKKGWLASWSTAGIQRTIELVGVKRTKTAAMNSAEGMKIVLERLREGGIKGVLEGMRHDRLEFGMSMGGAPSVEENYTQTRSWKQIWQRGVQDSDWHSHERDEDDH